MFKSLALIGLLTIVVAGPLAAAPTPLATSEQLRAALPVNLAIAGATVEWGACGGSPNVSVPSVIPQSLIETALCYSKNDRPKGDEILEGLRTYTQPDQAADTAAWLACGGTGKLGLAIAAQMISQAYLDAVVCYAKTDGPQSTRILANLDSNVLDYQSPKAPWNMTPAEINFKSNAYAAVGLAQMRVYVIRHDLRRASITGWYAGKDVYLPDEQSIYWNMLPSSMQDVILAHGGTRADNRNARPADWKNAGPGMDMWVYKTGAAVVTTYIFTNGKLTRTLKP